MKKGEAVMRAEGCPPPPSPRAHAHVPRLTIFSQACFPSMKPLGMALGVRISYLRRGEVGSEGHRARQAPESQDVTGKQSC